MTTTQERCTSRHAGRSFVGRAVAVGIAVAAIAVTSMAQPEAMAQQGRANAGKKKYVATLEITVDKKSGKLRKPTAAETEDIGCHADRVDQPIDRGFEAGRAAGQGNGRESRGPVRASHAVEAEPGRHQRGEVRDLV